MDAGWGFQIMRLYTKCDFIRSDSKWI